MNPTTDPNLRSWVPVAPDSHFPIQNLPLGVFRLRSGGNPTIGVAIGDFVLALPPLKERGLFASVKPGYALKSLDEWTINDLMNSGIATKIRTDVSQLLREDEPTLRDDLKLRDKALIPMSKVEMLLPVKIGDYTDFYSSREHATNVGAMMRGPENALMPNWLHLPVAYHGRASSVFVSGTDIRRPCGQRKPETATSPIFGPTKALDFELETGIIIGRDNHFHQPGRQGLPILVGQAAEHIFGMVLVNDWSARDIQQWEYQPLGPFLAKNFATSMSPWMVTMEALEPFRVPGPVQDPQPLPYLQSQGDWAYDIHLEVWLQGSKMDRPHRISASNFKHLYWNMCQQVAHHTVNGCNLQVGDLLASGTISGPTPDSWGSMLELAWKGTKPLQFPNGETRAFLQDGDRVTMIGWCQGPGYRIGFGEVTGQVLPATD